MATPDDTDRDDALLRRLYDEPDADGADGELAREVDSFRQLRGAISDYARATEVEPPSRGVDELLAAARQRAPVRTAAVPPEAPGFWARFRAWFQPIAAHPALASAAMVVLVAGVAGVLYLKGRTTVTESEVDRHESTIASAGPEQPNQPAADRGLVAGYDERTLDDTEVPKNLADQNASPPMPTPVATPEVAVPNDGTPKPGKEHYTGTGGKVKPAKPSVPTGRAPGRDKLELSEGGGGGDAGPDNVALGSGTMSGESETQTRAPVVAPAIPKPSDPTTTPPVGQPQKPPTTGTTTDTAEEVLIAGSDDDGKTKSDPGSTGSKKPDVEQLTRQARTAAKSGDCGVVKSIGGRVKKLDATYYKRTFSADTTIKKCL